MDRFTSGATSLDDWLKRRARANQVSGASRTYVVAEAGRVVGCYCLASGALALNDALAWTQAQHARPDPDGDTGTLTIDLAWQGRGLGASLLRDAVDRTQAASAILGIRGLLVHALSEAAKRFYAHHGFMAVPSRPMTLIMSLK